MEEEVPSVATSAFSPHDFYLELADGRLAGIGDTVYTEEEGAALVVEGFQLEECGWRVRCDCGDHSVMLYEQEELLVTKPTDN